MASAASLLSDYKGPIIVMRLLFSASQDGTVLTKTFERWHAKEGATFGALKEMLAKLFKVPTNKLQLTFRNRSYPDSGLLIDAGVHSGATVRANCSVLPANAAAVKDGPLPSASPPPRKAAQSSPSTETVTARSGAYGGFAPTRQSRAAKGATGLQTDTDSSICTSPSPQRDSGRVALRSHDSPPNSPSLHSGNGRGDRSRSGTQDPMMTQIMQISNEVDMLASKVYTLMSQVANGFDVSNQPSMVIEVLMQKMLLLDGLDCHNTARTERKNEINRINALLDQLETLKEDIQFLSQSSSLADNRGMSVASPLATPPSPMQRHAMPLTVLSRASNQTTPEGTPVGTPRSSHVLGQSVHSTPRNRPPVNTPRTPQQRQSNPNSVTMSMAVDQIDLQNGRLDMATLQELIRDMLGHEGGNPAMVGQSSSSLIDYITSSPMAHEQTPQSATSTMSRGGTSEMAGSWTSANVSQRIASSYAVQPPVRGAPCDAWTADADETDELDDDAIAVYYAVIKRLANKDAFLPGPVDSIHCLLRLVEDPKQSVMDFKTARQAGRSKVQGARQAGVSKDKDARQAGPSKNDACSLPPTSLMPVVVSTPRETTSQMSATSYAPRMKRDAALSLPDDGNPASQASLAPQAAMSAGSTGARVSHRSQDSKSARGKGTSAGYTSHGSSLAGGAHNRLGDTSHCSTSAGSNSARATASSHSNSSASNGAAIADKKLQGSDSAETTTQQVHTFHRSTRSSGGGAVPSSAHQPAALARGSGAGHRTRERLTTDGVTAATALRNTTPASAIVSGPASTARADKPTPAAKEHTGASKHSRSSTALPTAEQPSSNRVKAGGGAQRRALTASISSSSYNSSGEEGGNSTSNRVREHSNRARKNRVPSTASSESVACIPSASGPSSSHSSRRQSTEGSIGCDHGTPGPLQQGALQRKVTQPQQAARALSAEQAVRQQSAATVPINASTASPSAKDSKPDERRDNAADKSAGRKHCNTAGQRDLAVKLEFAHEAVHTVQSGVEAHRRPSAAHGRPTGVSTHAASVNTVPALHPGATAQSGGVGDQAQEANTPAQQVPGIPDKPTAPNAVVPNQQMASGVGGTLHAMQRHTAVNNAPSDATGAIDTVANSATSMPSHAAIGRLDSGGDTSSNITHNVHAPNALHAQDPPHNGASVPAKSVVELQAATPAPGTGGVDDRGGEVAAYLATAQSGNSPFSQPPVSPACSPSTPALPDTAPLLTGLRGEGDTAQKHKQGHVDYAFPTLSSGKLESNRDGTKEPKAGCDSTALPAIDGSAPVRSSPTHVYAIESGLMEQLAANNAAQMVQHGERHTTSTLGKTIGTWSERGSQVTEYGGAAIECSRSSTAELWDDDDEPPTPLLSPSKDWTFDSGQAGVKSYAQTFGKQQGASLFLSNLIVPKDIAPADIADLFAAFQSTNAINGEP